MKLRFQADNDLDQRIVVATKRLDPGVDFQTAPALGLHDVDDPDVLALAAREGRVLVSHDRTRLCPTTSETSLLHRLRRASVSSRKRCPLDVSPNFCISYWAASEAEEYANIIYNPS